MRNRWSCVSLLAVVAGVLAARPVAAQPRLFGTTGSDGTISTLVELDPATGGLLQTIGSVGYTVNGLTYDSSTGRMWGSTSRKDPSFVGLIEINMTTGAGTPVGTGWGLGSGAVVCITTNGAGDMYGWWEPFQDDLVSIDKVTGLATRIGESGIDTAGLGLSFNGAGALYLYNDGGEYFTIDPNTGAGTLVGDLGGTAHHGDFHPVSDIYYGIDTAWENPRNIRMLDLGLDSDLGSLPTINDLHTITWVPQQGPDPVPEAGTLAALSGFVTSGGLWWWRRRARS